MPKGKYCGMMTVYFNKRSHLLLGNSKLNMFQWLSKHVPAATDANNRGTVGSGVFYEARAKYIQGESTEISS
jgi:hypothetical protein